MKFTKIFPDETGETHFGTHEVADRTVAMGPPPNPPGQMSDCGTTSSMCVFSVPAGTSAPAHNAPQPYIAIVLSGEAEVVASDGEWRRFLPGDVLFCEDTVGKGHVTRAVSDLKLAFVNRAQTPLDIAKNIEGADVLADASTGLKFTESPRWHQNKLWFLDIHDKRIKTADINGTVKTVVELPFIPNAFGPTPDGQLIVGDAFARTIHCWNGTELKQLADISAMTTFCLSDGIVDPKGRMYVGDIGYNFNDPQAKPADTCVLVLVQTDGTASVVAEGLSFPNGIVITPDGRTLIVAETLSHRLTAFDIRDDGSLAGRRVWAQLPTTVGPDGICLDASGGVWCANPESHDSVVRVVEGGEITHRIALGVNAYAVMLGGSEGRDLIISTSESHDPKAIHQSPSACLRRVKVDIPGAGFAAH
jgi:sugar lactone lactonase YvrE